MVLEKFLNLILTNGQEPCLRQWAAADTVTCIWWTETGSSGKCEITVMLDIYEQPTYTLPSRSPVWTGLQAEEYDNVKEW